MLVCGVFRVYFFLESLGRLNFFVDCYVLRVELENWN